MDDVIFRSANRLSSLAFLHREPDDRSQELRYFTVRLCDTNLAATARVYGYMRSGLPNAFDRIAAEWQSLTGPLEWSSLECEFCVAITHDGLGHFTLRNSLSQSRHDDGWEVTNHVVVETSQLDRLATDLRAFIGRCS